MSKIDVREIMELSKQGFSQAEISRRLGISKTFVSIFFRVHEVLSGDFAGKKEKLEEERRAVRQEKEEHRKNVEEVVTIRKKLSALKANMEEKQNQDRKLDEEINRKRSEHQELKSQIGSLGEEKERHKNEIRDAEEYRQRREELEREYRILEERAELERSELRTATQKRDDMEKEKEELEKECENIIAGKTLEILPFFLRLTPHQKACVLSFVPGDEMKRVLREAFQMTMVERMLRSI